MNPFSGNDVSYVSAGVAFSLFALVLYFLCRHLAGRMNHRLHSFREANRALETQLHKTLAELSFATAEMQKQSAESRKVKEQFLQSQKMEAIGRLAGGVAHDFNNLLTAIMGYCSLLLRATDPGDARAADVEQIKLSAERGAALTRQLLAMSRKQVLRLKAVDLNEGVRMMDKLLRRLLGENIDLQTALNASRSIVKGDSGKLEQVIMNLAVNARDAMPEGGKLIIQTSNVEVEAAFSDETLDLPKGFYAMLSVSDNGIGMNADTLSHLFEPFFTTKTPDKGTGLGLSTVYGIVKQCGGAIQARSQVGLGSVFKIYFPLAQEEVTPALAANPPPSSLRGSETILLVEDEMPVRELACRVLREHGYNVLAGSHAEDAIKQLNTYKGKLDLLVTDVMLPRMNGKELAERMIAKFPEAKVLFCSGYTKGAMVASGEEEPSLPFLQKPFTPDGLAARVRELLDGKRVEAKSAVDG